MKCYRYVIEGYDDWIHRYGYFKGYKIYIPEPYNFCVFTLDDKIKYIKRQKVIDDFKNDYFGFNPKINEIDMDEELIKKLYDTLKKEEEIKEERNKLTDNVLKYKTNEELADDSFEKARLAFKDKNYDLSIELYNKSIEGNYALAASYYNIACNYSMMGNKEKAIEYINKSLNEGYNNWYHMICDKDLQNIIDEPEMVEIIKTLIIKKPTKERRSWSIDKNGNDKADIYLIKHNLIEFYFDEKDIIDKARHKMENKLYEEAIKLYSKIMDKGIMKPNQYYDLASCYALLNDKVNTLKFLELSIDKGYRNIVNLVRDSNFKKYKKDKDFIRIVKDLNKKPDADIRFANNEYQLYMNKYIHKIDKETKGCIIC